MAELHINGLKANAQMKFYSDVPEGEAEIGEMEANILTERIGK